MRLSGTARSSQRQSVVSSGAEKSCGQCLRRACAKLAGAMQSMCDLRVCVCVCKTRRRNAIHVRPACVCACVCVKLAGAMQSMCDLRAWLRVCTKLAGAMQSVCDLRRVHEMEAMQMLPGNVNWSLKTAVNVFLSLVHTARQATKGNR